MNIYIVDYLGIHCGMHYYLQSFKSLLKSGGNNNVELLSNFPDDNKKVFFRNQYFGTSINKIRALIINYLTLLKFVKKHKKDCFIFLSYGNIIEIPFICTLTTLKKHLIDVHEVIAQHKDQNKIHLSLFRTLYKNKIKSIILHSERSRSFVNSFGYRGKVFTVPHVSYTIQKDINKDSLSEEIINAFREKKTNILFFGNVNFNKGVDILIDAVNRLDEVDKNKLHVVIAGKNFDDSIYAVKPSDPSLFTLLIRHIEDNELIYLYEHADFIAMPYRKTSQSGVLEMAFYFKKPVIASSIPYFKQVLLNYPSFGIIGEGTISETDYSNIIKQALNTNYEYFSENDYSRYMNRSEFKSFIEEFNDWVNNED